MILLDEKASGIFRKRLDNGREIFSCKCPSCGVIHGGYDSFEQAWVNIKCKEHYRSEIEGLKKDIEKVDKPAKPRDIFTQPMRKPARLGEAADDDFDMKDVLYGQESESVAYALCEHDLGRYYVITPDGHITKWADSWVGSKSAIHAPSKEWSVHSLGTGDPPVIISWPEMRSLLDSGKTLRGAFIDVDHGTVNRWGGEVEIYRLSNPVEIKESHDDDFDMKDFTAPWQPGEVNINVAREAYYGQIFFHRTAKNADGTPVRVRASGKCKTWKTRPNEYRLPVKYGLYQSLYITDANQADWTTGSGK